MTNRRSKPITLNQERFQERQDNTTLRYYQRNIEREFLHRASLIFLLSSNRFQNQHCNSCALRSNLLAY